MSKLSDDFIPRFLCLARHTNPQATGSARRTKYPKLIQYTTTARANCPFPPFLRVTPPALDTATMRLPFTSSRKPAESVPEAAHRTSSEEGPDDQPRGDRRGSTDDGASDRSTAHSTSMPLDTPATSYSSTNSVKDRQGKKTGMYKLSGMKPCCLFLAAGNVC